MMEHIFEDLIKHLKNLMDQLSQAYASFAVYEGIKESAAPNISGDKRAQENVKTMNGYNNFFSTVEWAAFVHAILTLAKFFDNGKRGQALSIFRVIEFIRSNRPHLSVEHFKQYYQGRFALEELTKGYTGVTDEQLAAIETDIKKNENVVTKIKTLRDQYFAHNDIKKDEVKISSGEIMEVFKIVEEVLQKICHETMRERWSFGRLQEDGKHDTSFVIDHLRRFKPYYLKEFEERDQKELLRTQLGQQEILQGP